jgi:AraC family transcriptional regulator
MSDVHSSQVGHLAQHAITVFETDRTAAGRYVGDATKPLGTGSVEPCNNSLATGNGLRRGGLANWQAKRVLAYVEANLGSKIAVRALAELVDLSKSHFAREFKRSVGFSPMAYVSTRRVERAKLMMTSTQECLADVALACGFTDQPHLTRYFRRLVGTTPGVWRRL